MEKLSTMKTVNIKELAKRMPDDCQRLNKLLLERKQYMKRKVGEFSARQIDDNEF